MTLADHLGSVMHNGKHDSWVKCATFAECKSDISAVLMDKSGLDFFMISGVGNGWLGRGLVWEPDGIWWWFLIVRMEVKMVWSRCWSNHT